MASKLIKFIYSTNFYTIRDIFGAVAFFPMYIYNNFSFSVSSTEFIVNNIFYLAGIFIIVFNLRK